MLSSLEGRSRWLKVRLRSETGRRCRRESKLHQARNCNQGELMLKTKLLSELVLMKLVYQVVEVDEIRVGRQVG